MPKFNVYAPSDKLISWDMPDSKLMEAYENWLADKDKPDHFIGTDSTGQRIAVHFPAVYAIVEQAQTQNFPQGSPALGPRPIQRRP